MSQDFKINEYGRKLINLCISTGLRIVNGRLHEDKEIGKYTCIKKRGCSVVDYVIGSSDFFKYIHNFKVNDHTPFSDHNIIQLSLPSIQYNGNITKTDFEECVKGKKFTWSNECIIKYQEAL